MTGFRLKPLIKLVEGLIDNEYLQAFSKLKLNYKNSN